MSYEKTWTFLPNQIPLDQTDIQHQSRSFLLQLKNYLVNTAGWTVTGSSNSVIVNTTDLWTGSSAIVYAPLGSPFSWITLKSPEGIVAGMDGSYTGNQSRLWITFACVGYDSSTSYVLTMCTSSIAPTGGTITALPSNIIKFDKVPFIKNNYINVLPCHFHFASTSEGGFYGAISQDNSGMMESIIYVLPLASPGLYGNIDYPYAFVEGIYSNTNTNADFTYSLFDSTTGTTTFSATLSHDSTAGNNRALILYSPLVVVAPIGIGGGTTAAGDINGNILDSPIFIYNSAAGKRAMMGHIPDFYYFGSNSISNGSVTPSSGTPTHNYIGNLLVPCNAAFSL